MGHPRVDTFTVFLRNGSGIPVTSQSVGKLRHQKSSYTSRIKAQPGAHLMASYALLKAVSFTLGLRL